MQFLSFEVQTLRVAIAMSAWRLVTHYTLLGWLSWGESIYANNDSLFLSIHSTKTLFSLWQTTTVNEARCIMPLLFINPLNLLNDNFPSMLLTRCRSEVLETPSEREQQAPLTKLYFLL